MTPEPTTTRPDRPNDSPPDPKPDLRLVAPTTDTQGTEPSSAPIAAGSSASVDEDVATPAKAATGRRVKPLAPLDQQLLANARLILQTAPRWAERPPALAEIWDYSTNGDWTAEDKSIKRLAHALIVVITFVVLYPISWAVQLALHKPAGFVITVAVLFVIYQLH